MIWCGSFDAENKGFELILIALIHHLVGIFKDMYELRLFNSEWEYLELRRMLAEAIQRGYVEKISVMKPHRWVRDEEWYRDKETGEIYSLAPPEEKNRGHWIKVDSEDLMKPGETVQ